MSVGTVSFGAPDMNGSAIVAAQLRSPTSLAADVIVIGAVTATTDALYLLQGDGQGALSPPGVVYTSTGKISALAVGNFDDDPHLDLVIIETPIGALPQIVVLLGDGSGAASTRVVGPMFTLGTPLALAVADFNCDGYDDVAAVTPSTTGLLSTFKGGMGGVLTEAAPILQVGHAPLGVAAEDLDGDCLPEIVVSSSADGMVYVLHNATPP